MLTEIYIEALLVDENLADQVWGLWDARLISDDLAALAWWLILVDCQTDDLLDVLRQNPDRWHFGLERAIFH